MLNFTAQYELLQEKFNNLEKDYQRTLNIYIGKVEQNITLERELKIARDDRDRYHKKLKELGWKDSTEKIDPLLPSERIKTSVNCSVLLSPRENFKGHNEIIKILDEHYQELLNLKSHL